MLNKQRTFLNFKFSSPLSCFANSAVIALDLIEVAYTCTVAVFTMFEVLSGIQAYLAKKLPKALLYSLGAITQGRKGRRLGWRIMDAAPAWPL